MLKLDKKRIEKIFNKKIPPNKKVIGIDTASRTGWCFIKSNTNWIYLDYGFLDIKSKNYLFKYNELIKFFDNILTGEEDYILIEDTFCGFNKKTFKLLSRIGGIVYTVGRLKKAEKLEFLLATQARKYLGLNGSAKKVKVQAEFKRKTKIKIEDDDVIDAIVLALVALFKCQIQKKSMLELQNEINK